MALTFESVQDAIAKPDPRPEAINAVLDEMQHGLTVKFAQHYHDEWVADYRAQGGVQQAPHNQHSDLLDMDTTLNAQEQQMLYDAYVGPAAEALAGIKERVAEHFTRSQSALKDLSDRYWRSAEALQDSYSSTHQDTVKISLQAWEGEAGDLVRQNFADPLGIAYENHRDMLKELSNAAALDLALLKKGQLYAKEIVDQAAASLPGGTQSQPGDATAVLVLTIFTGIAGLVSAGAGTPLAAFLWAGVSAAGSTAGALVSMGTHSEHQFSDVDGVQLVQEIHATFDDLSSMLEDERGEAVGGMRDAFEEQYKSKLNGDPTVSSTVIPNINGYQA